ncbi:MAG TPA: 2OG-Fe(II) oxygenase [Rhizomicrobium sp.]|nr:2OG-Fe(II) oxygenase [Rhizomicrobium sp.]
MSVQTLETRARQGDVDALLELGTRYESENKVQSARGCFATAAKTGSLVGLRRLAINLLSQEPIEGEAGINMIRAAADKGDIDAVLVCASLSAGDIALPDRAKVARQCLEIAAERGSSRAREQLEFLEHSATDIDARALPRHEIFTSPLISVIEGFATPAECDWVMERARPHLHRAHVYNPSDGGFFTQEARTNSSVEFGIANTDVVIAGLRLRIRTLCGLDRLEMSSILHYAPGQEFRPHYDFLDPAQPGHARDIERSGQRAATFLIYLNEDYEGGETEFLKLGWRYKGRKGDALLFWNLDPAGAPDYKTMHAGTPTTAGEKWVFSQWLRLAPKP